MLSKFAKRGIIGLVAVMLSGALLVACSSPEPTATPVPTVVPTATPVPLDTSETIMLHDGQWGSNWVHLAVAGYVLENGYGYTVEEVQGTTGTQKLTLVEGDVHGCVAEAGDACPRRITERGCVYVVVVDLQRRLGDVV